MEDGYSEWLYIKPTRVAMHDDHRITLRTPDDIVTTNSLLESKFMVDTVEECIASLDRLIAKNKKLKLTWSRK